MSLQSICDGKHACANACPGRSGDLVCSTCQRWWCVPCVRLRDSHCPACPAPELTFAQAQVVMLAQAYLGRIPNFTWASDEQEKAGELLHLYRRDVRAALKEASDKAVPSRFLGRSGPPPDGFWLGVLRILAACLDPPALEPPLH